MAKKNEKKQEKGTPMTGELKSMLGATEGWMAEKRWDTKRYHYIRDTVALCRVAFYRGELVPQPGDAPKGSEDCAACYRHLMRERKKAKVQP